MIGRFVDQSLGAQGLVAERLLDFANRRLVPTVNKIRLAVNHILAERFNVLRYGASGDGSHDDTNAIAAAIADASLVGGVVTFPPGTYLTDPITLTEGTNDGITFQGAGRFGQFGGGGTILKLRRQASCLISINGLRYRFLSLTLDGNTLPTTGVMLFVPNASEIEFVNVSVHGAGLTGGPNPSDVVVMTGTSEIDNIVFRKCRFAQNLANVADRCPNIFKNYNSNAFNVSVEHSHITGGDVLFHFQQGSIDVRHCQVFEFTTAAFRVETYGQQHTIDDVYTERNPFTVNQSSVFYQQVFNAHAVSTRPARILNCQINDEADITMVGTQPLYIENVVTAGNIAINPAADQSLTGTVDTNSTTAIVGHGSLFLSEAPSGAEIYLAIDGETHRIESTASDVALTLSTSMTTTNPGTTAARTYGFNRLTLKNVRFVTAGRGVIGAGYPSQVDESMSIYYASLQVSRRLPFGYLRQASTSWMDQDRSVFATDGQLIDAINPFTGNRTWTWRNYGATDGLVVTVSRSGAADAHTLTMKNAAGSTLATLSNVIGAVGMVMIYFDETAGWKKLKDFVN